jgi:uncharacterized integral membrane protein
MMPSQGRPEPKPSGFRPNSRQIIGGVFAVALIIFIAVNNVDAQVNLIVKTVKMPLWLVLAVTALLGFVIGMAFGARRTKRKYMDV